jgi:hypothetical protein
MTRKQPPRPPSGLQAGGRRLWRAITRQHALEQHEADLLTQACRTVDLLERLEAAATAGPLTVDGRANPVIVEARQQRITLARLLAALRLPDADAGRPQRRTGARGVYQAARRGQVPEPARAEQTPAPGNVASLDERRAKLLADEGGG